MTALAGCSLSAPDDGEAPPGAADPASITINLPNYPATLDPGKQYDESTYSVYRNIYDQLLRRDPQSLEPVPWIATEWETVDDTTWTFTIRDDVTFSDGSELTADDVAFSIERILDSDYGSPQRANFSAIESAEATSPTEVTITTGEPSPTLLSYLTTLSIVPQDYVEEVGDEGLNENPVGSGPYQVASATSGSSITLERNPEFWGEEPSIEEVTFAAVPDVASRVSNLQSGQAQLVTGLTADQAGQLDGSDDLTVLSAPTERVAYLAINVLGDTPTQDPDVRRAISLAINYDAIIENLLGGYASPVGTVLTPLALGYPEELETNEYDPEQAQQLIEDAGVSGVEIDFPTSPSFDPQVVQAIQSDLNEAGLSVQIQNSDHATYLQTVQSPDHDWGSVRFGQWSCSCLDADGVLYPLFSTGTVWSAYANPEFDDLVEQARSTLDEGERMEAYTEAVDIIRSDIPGIGLYQVHSIYGAASNLHWEPDAVQSLYVDQMSFGE